MDTIGSKTKTLSWKDYVLRRGKMEAEKHRYVKRVIMADLPKKKKKKLISTIVQERATGLLEQGDHIGDDEKWLNY